VGGIHGPPSSDWDKGRPHDWHSEDGRIRPRLVFEVVRKVCCFVILPGRGDQASARIRPIDGECVSVTLQWYARLQDPSTVNECVPLRVATRPPDSQKTRVFDLGRTER
jgi:hypothetical protein